MRKHCSDVCKLRPCLNKESKNSARLHTIVTAALQQQYLQTELIFWISLVYVILGPEGSVKLRHFPFRVRTMPFYTGLS